MPKTVRAGSVAKLSVRVPNAVGDRAVTVQVTDPSGKPAKSMGDNLVAGKKPVTKELSFAYNDPAGVWTVRVTDLYGNVSTEEKVNLKAE